MLAGQRALIPALAHKLALKPREEFAREIQKIAVLRANRLGDFILALPALQALRRTFPQSEIVLLGREWHEDFLKDRPGPVDRVVVVPPIPGIIGNPGLKENPYQVEQFFQEMAQEHFDLAIQVHGDGRYSNPFVRRLGARMTVGTRMPEAIPLDLWVPFTYSQSEILRHLEVVSLVGAQAAVLEPHLSVTKRDLVEANEIMNKDGKPLVVIHPGAENPRQRWPVEKFAMAADALAFSGAHIAIIGTEAEQDLVRDVQETMTVKSDNLCNRLSIGGLAGYLSQSSLVISNNTDYLRLAWSVGTPTVGIYWFGSLLTNGPLIRAKHRPAVSWRVICPVCGLDCVRFSCEHTISLMDEVTVVEVLSSALDLISSNTRGLYS